MQLQKDPFTIHWGLEEEANLPLKSTSAGSVVQIGNREFIGITQQNLVRFETTAILDYLPYQLSALVSIRDQQVLVGVTSVTYEFVVILLKDLKNPIYTKIKTKDASILNMMYLPKSSLLITSGEDLKVWRFDFYYNFKSIIPTEPRIKIEYQRTIINGFQGSILNPPIVDFTTEILYLDDNNGSLQMYKATTGENIGCAIKYQSASKTTIALNQESKKILTSNADQGTILYHKSGFLNKRFLLSYIATLSIRFINKEYAILLDANNGLTILDVKTAKSFLCYKGEKAIKRLFVFNEPIPRLILCFNTSIVTFRIVLPWKYWATTISTPISMIRCSKYNEAARLLVLCSNSHLKLISPSMKGTLTAATLSTLASPFMNGFYYDRGNDGLKRDQLMLPLKDGQIQIFSTGENPCQLVSTVDAKATCICLCEYQNKKCFVFGTSAGDLLFYDYETLTKFHRIVLIPFPIIKIYYFDGSLCLVFVDKLVRFSLRDEKICETLKIDGSEVSISFNNVVIFGYENGEIGSACFNTTENCELIEHFTNGLKIHDDKITCLSLGLEKDYFVSCSLDMSVRIWTTIEMSLLMKFVFPVQLFSVAVLNGKRDVVVGTDYEIMFIKGESIFNDLVDVEDEVFDNYDKKIDFLSSQFSQIGKEKEDEESSFLDSRKNQKNESNEKRKPINNKIKRITEAWKKHEEMLNNRLNELSNKEEQESRQNNKKKELDKDERERLFNAMNEITNGKPKKVVIPNAEKEKKKKKEKEYEYEYEYYEEEDESENETENNRNQDSQSDLNSENGDQITIQKNSIDSNIEENESTNDTENTNDDNNNDDGVVIKIMAPSHRNGSQRPRRNIQRNHQRDSSDLNQDDSYELFDYNDESRSSYNGSGRSCRDVNSHSNKGKRKSSRKSRKRVRKTQNKEENQSNNKGGHNGRHRHVDDNGSDLYDEDVEYEYENGIRKVKRKSNYRKFTDHSHNNNIVSTDKDGVNGGESNRHCNNAKNKDSAVSSASSLQNNKNESRNQNKSNVKNNQRQQQKQQHDSSSRLAKQIDHKTRMNLFLVNSSINDASASTRNNTSTATNTSDDRNASSALNNGGLNGKARPSSSITSNKLIQNQNQMIKVKATRRFPTPLGYHFVHPGLSLFERSLKPRRPKTPDKTNNGLIISRSVVPTNIILDASALDAIIESNDDRYRPLLNQIRPLLRSRYRYFGERERWMSRHHAFFNLSVMIPAYRRNRQQIRHQLQELRQISQDKINRSIVPPIKIEEISPKGGQINIPQKINVSASSPSSPLMLANEPKPKRLIDIGKVRNSYYGANKKSDRNLQVTPRIFRVGLKRKASCPQKVHKPIVLGDLRSSQKVDDDKNKLNFGEYSESSNFIESLCSGRERRVIHDRRQKSMSLAWPTGSLYVTGKLMIGNSPRNKKNQQKRNINNNNNDNDNGNQKEENNSNN